MAKSKSAVTHKSYTLTYRENGEPTPKKLSFNITAKEQSATGLIGERLKQVTEIIKRPGVEYLIGAFHREKIDAQG